ncbi:unnamed protein product [Gordionus sp. m RMFG-2023]
MEGSDETTEGWAEPWPGEQGSDTRVTSNLIIPKSREAEGTRESNDGQGDITGDEQRDPDETDAWEELRRLGVKEQSQTDGREEEKKKIESQV